MVWAVVWGRGRPQNHRECMNSVRSLSLGGAEGGAGGPRIIVNEKNSTRFHGLGGGVGGAGGPGIIGHAKNSMHIYGLGGAVGGHGGPQNPWKCREFCAFTLFGVWCGGRGRGQSYRNEGIGPKIVRTTPAQPPAQPLLTTPLEQVTDFHYFCCRWT